MTANSTTDLLRDTAGMSIGWAIVKLVPGVVAIKMASSNSGRATKRKATPGIGKYSLADRLPRRPLKTLCGRYTAPAATAFSSKVRRLYFSASCKAGSRTTVRTR